MCDSFPREGAGRGLAHCTDPSLLLLIANAPIPWGENFTSPPIQVPTLKLSILQVSALEVAILIFLQKNLRK
jgi:hypothetical protein